MRQLAGYAFAAFIIYKGAPILFYLMLAILSAFIAE